MDFGSCFCFAPTTALDDDRDEVSLSGKGAVEFEDAQAEPTARSGTGIKSRNSRQSKKLNNNNKSKGNAREYRNAISDAADAWAFMNSNTDASVDESNDTSVVAQVPSKRSARSAGSSFGSSGLPSFFSPSLKSIFSKRTSRVSNVPLPMNEIEDDLFVNTPPMVSEKSRVVRKGTDMSEDMLDLILPTDEELDEKPRRRIPFMLVVKSACVVASVIAVLQRAQKV